MKISLPCTEKNMIQITPSSMNTEVTYNEYDFINSLLQRDLIAQCLQDQ
jgi:hypothetical protein